MGSDDLQQMETVPPKSSVSKANPIPKTSKKYTIKSADTIGKKRKKEQRLVCRTYRYMNFAQLDKTYAD